MYIICWQNIQTKEKGKGLGRLRLDEVKMRVRSLNQEHRDVLYHWFEQDKETEALTSSDMATSRGNPEQ
jgi:hypothetical protein